jgi:3-deoxy-D-manno-octulosonate 8-phosphate phosphatase (KDO 8-P phosphatase)
VVDERAKKIRLLMLDVDGVMTNGKIIINSNGIETKIFDVRDGHGIKMLMREGIDVIIITGRESEIVNMRAKELGIREVYQKVLKKIDKYEEILREKNLKDEDVCYIGDDLVDLPILRRVGFAIAVADSIDDIKRYVHYITKRRGGDGAVREVTELILKSQNRWDEVVKRYFN